MSRSRPHAQQNPNPATRWVEWQGETGVVRYYDKDAKTNHEVPLPFTFLLLDELATVGGWNDASQSAIYANEVRDTRTDVLTVKSFKGGEIATGLYSAIKEHVTSKAVGGHFMANCYIAFKDDRGALALGALRFKGAALGSWMDFRKEHRADLYDKAVVVTGYTEGKKGRITFRMPTFALKDTSAQTNADAQALDATLQAYLDVYLSRTVKDADAGRAHDEPPSNDDDDQRAPTDFDADSIPFSWVLPLILPVTLAASSVLV
jgi:hypothetical protein